MRSLLMTTAALMALASPAAAESYVRADFGLALNQEIDGGGFELDLSDDVTFGGAVGYDFGAVRAEIEGRYISADTEQFGISADIHAIPVFVNAAVDLPRFGAVQPYLGGGAGYAWAEANVMPFGSIDADGFAYQAFAGVAISVDDASTIDVGYRRVWMDLETETFGPAFEFDGQSDAVTVGYRHRI